MFNYKYNEREGKMEEECGVIGLYSTTLRDDLMISGYLGMQGIQHRGQECAGMTICDSITDGEIRQKTIKNMGLVSDVFSIDEIKKYIGNILVGHVRYATTGVSSIENCHPFRGDSEIGKISLVHNGNLINIENIKKQMLEEGSIFNASSDTELILKLIGRNAKLGYKESLLKILNMIEGSFALLIIIDDKLIAIRDPRGIRPLCLGKTDDDIYVVVSESTVLDTLKAKFIRDVEPGEMLIIDKNGMESIKYSENVKKYPCSFEYIYFARPDSIIDGIDVYSIRHESGRYLYKQKPIEADIVVGVPDSGIPAAIGYAEESGIPYMEALVKNKYIGRSFIYPTQELRELAVKVKLNPIKKLIKNKRVVVIDDSLVRGTTSKKLIKMIREAGAKEVHFRSASPKVISECYFGVDIANKEELIASYMNTDEISKEINVDTLDFLSVENFKKILGNGNFCMGCLTGKYPILDEKD